MPSCKRSRNNSLGCGCLCLVLGIACVVLAEWGVKHALIQIVTNTLTMDSASKFEKIFGKQSTFANEVAIFNFTNAHAVMNSAVPIKPVFEEVSVKFSTKAGFFDYDLSDDRAEYSHKTWSFTEYVNPADANLVIITPNTVLTETLLVFGGEAALKATYDGINAAGTQATGGLTTDPFTIYAAGCQILMPATTQQCMGMALLYAALLFESFHPLRPDGTSTNNMGIYTRRTVDEMLNGFVDPLTQQAIPGVFGAYNQYGTMEELQQALSSGAENPAMFTSVKKTGRGLPPHARDEWVSIKSFRELNATPVNPPWAPPFPYYDRNGKVGADREPSFRIAGAGLRGLTNAISPLSSWPSVLSAGIPPSAQASSRQLTYFDDAELFRDVSYSCGECKYETRNGVRVIAYTFDDENGGLRTDGTNDEAGACAASFTCDYAMSSPFLFPVAPASPLVYSLPYFGKSVASTSATFMDAETGQELVYNDTIHRKVLYIEPFSGALIGSSSFSQVNVRGLTGANFNGQLFLNPATGGFAGANLPPVAPLTLAKAAGSGEELSILATGLTAAYVGMLISLVAGALLIVCAVYYLITVRPADRVATSPAKSTKDTNRATSDASDVSEADAPHTMTIELGSNRPPSFTVSA